MISNSLHEIFVLSSAVDVSFTHLHTHIKTVPKCKKKETNKNYLTRELLNTCTCMHTLNKNTQKQFLMYEV